LRKRTGAARSKGGGVEVDASGVTVTKSSARIAWARGRRWHALSLGLKWQHALRPGTRQWCATGLGSRMASGGGMMVSRVTEEREVRNLLSVASESVGPEILGRGT
jgi:hypothetical protein